MAILTFGFGAITVKNFKVLLYSATVALAVFPAQAATDLTTIGKAALVNPETVSTPPQRASRTLATGDQVYQQERIATSESGITQLLFADESTLTLGPNSTLVLDSFVYDPEAAGNSMVVTLSKGLTRLIGGRISKGQTMELRTPHAAVGIRGGMTLVAVGDETFAVPLFGILTCSKGDTTETVTSARMACVIGEELRLVEVTPEQIAQLLALLEGPTGSENAALDEQILKALNLYCSSAFAADDPSCTPGSGGLAHVAPEDFGPGLTAEELADLIEQLQEATELEEEIESLEGPELSGGSDGL